MPVWVRVRVRRPNRPDEIEVSAKVNTGFTVGAIPVIRLPESIAHQLGFDVRKGEFLPDTVDAAGRPLPIRQLGLVEVKAVTPDRESPWVRALAVYTGGASVLLNDYLIEALLIEIVMPGSGFWRFRGEDRLRESATPEYFSKNC